MVNLYLTEEQYEDLRELFRGHLNGIWLSDDYERDKKIIETVVGKDGLDVGLEKY